MPSSNPVRLNLTSARKERLMELLVQERGDVYPSLVLVLAQQLMSSHPGLFEIDSKFSWRRKGGIAQFELDVNFRELGHAIRRGEIVVCLIE